MKRIGYLNYLNKAFLVRFLLLKIELFISIDKVFPKILLDPEFGAFSGRGRKQKHLKVSVPETTSWNSDHLFIIKQIRKNLENNRIVRNKNQPVYFRNSYSYKTTNGFKQRLITGLIEFIFYND